MQYQGSKRKIAKYILPIILYNRKPNQYYIEPFVGGANIIDKVDGLRIGADENKYVIALLQALQNGWIPPDYISKEEYAFIRANKEIDLVLTGWCGICCSYGAKWFGGWAGRPSKINAKPPQISCKIGVAKQNLKGIEFIASDYKNLVIPNNSIIYCDPPYENTLGYKNIFDHFSFWQWCRDMNNIGHTIFVSEYNAPEDFICIKEIIVNKQMANGSNSETQIRNEKLFTLC